jgi:hypothetical protein
MTFMAWKRLKLVAFVIEGLARLHFPDPRGLVQRGCHHLAPIRTKPGGQNPSFIFERFNQGPARLHFPWPVGMGLQSRGSGSNFRRAGTLLHFNPAARPDPRIEPSWFPRLSGVTGDLLMKKYR